MGVVLIVLLWISYCAMCMGCMGGTDCWCLLLFPGGWVLRLL